MILSALSLTFAPLNVFVTVSIGRLFITGLSEEVADDVAVGLEEVAVLEIGFLEVVVEETLDDEEGFCDEGF